MPKKSASKKQTPVVHSGRVSQTAPVASVADFKAKTKGTVVELPSGVVVKLRKPDGLKALLSGGKIPNSLMGIVEQALNPERKGDVDMSDLGQNPEAMADLFRLIDNMTVDAFLEPKVHPAPETEEERDDDKVYVDEVDINDRFWILSWAMAGVKDVAPFRPSANTGVEGVADGAGVPVPAVGTPGAD